MESWWIKRKKLVLILCCTSTDFHDSLNSLRTSLLKNYILHQSVSSFYCRAADRSALRDDVLSWTTVFNFHHNFQLRLGSRLFVGHIIYWPYFFREERFERSLLCGKMLYPHPEKWSQYIKPHFDLWNEKIVHQYIYCSDNDCHLPWFSPGINLLSLMIVEMFLFSSGSYL